MNTVHPDHPLPLPASPLRPVPAHRLRRALRRHGGNVLLITPFLALFGLFGIWPVLRSAYLSFTDYHATDAGRWIGLGNYIELFQDDRFYRALANTTLYMVMVSIISVLLGLALAVAWGSQRRSHRWLRVAFFLPSVAGGVGVISVWKYLANSEPYGLFNTVRAVLGLEPVRFLGDPAWSLPLLTMIAVWSAMGYNMVIFVAGMRSIPADLHEAAALDGATPAERFLHITLPLLRPTLVYSLITGMITSFQVFYEPYILFGTVGAVGGPLDSALMLVSYLFDHGYNQLNLGYACAVAWVLTTILFLLTLVNLRLGRTHDSH
ncbi:carbohydrate ABC transporter permease [Eleftheria terrae]|uniref:carbohydrate ABC transporter permease n=1 Tax=Eleftheria terrae TaxID=1597781 RepID=UPI00263BE0EA|nr:sugar ABC transporter permease [Eleftheria terrae]WKB55840.1 sugar ABC transporter permease [Eleftheria terrae]